MAASKPHLLNAGSYPRFRRFTDFRRGASGLLSFGIMREATTDILWQKLYAALIQRQSMAEVANVVIEFSSPWHALTTNYPNGRYSIPGRNYRNTPNLL